MKTVWYAAGKAFEESKTVRRAVFIDEQGYTEEEEFDEIDLSVPHLVLFDGETPVATGRLILSLDGTAKLGRIAVLKSYRGRHLGAEVVKELLSKAKESGAKRAYVSAQVYAVPFYNRFGFKEYGSEYLDGRIPHIDMDMPL